MHESKFGRLERVSLEEMWNGDGRDFLGWLARDENLTYLGELLDTSLKPDTMTEDKLRKDPMLVCLDRETNSRYVILSPVVKTEDRGLGRLIVYAANFQPVNLILMAGKFHPSHTKALSWLNSATNQDLSLYAMEVEFWRIGNSALAPNFTLVISPGEAVGRIAPAKPANVPMDPVEMTQIDELDEDIIQPETGTLARLDSVFPSDLEEEGGPTTPVDEEEIQSVAGAQSLTENGAESRITPSGMRKMFSSRRFSETVTGDLPEEEKAPAEEKTPAPNIFAEAPSEDEPAKGDETGQVVALRKTSPIRIKGEGSEESQPASPDVGASWDSLQQTSNLQNPETDYPDVEATITPSGMLQRLQVRDSKTVAEATAGTNSKRVVTSDEYVEFWAQFLTDVIEFDGDQPTERSMPQGWISFPFDREHFSLVAFLNKTHGLGGIGLVIDGPECKSHYANLLQDREQIEGEVGEGLDWRELPEKDESHIYLHRKNVDISNRANWTEYQNWFADALEVFMRIFGNRIETLGSSIMWGE